MNHSKEKKQAESGILPFDPIVVIQDVCKRWLLVVLITVMVGVGTYIVTDLRYEPVYQTNTTFVVSTKGSAGSVYGNLTSTTELASVFTELLNSTILRKTIEEELGASVGGTVTTAVIPNTNLITMQVSASDPWTAFVVAQSIIEHHETLTYRVVDGIVLEVLQAPVMPAAAVNSANAMYQMKRMMVLAAMGSVVLLALMSALRNTVRSEKEARKKLDCDYLGEVPHEKKRKTFLAKLTRRKSSILLTSPLTSFRFVESIRKLRRRVEQYMDGGKVLMVTSLLENEGKSTVAVNLALALSQKHGKVLLMDCDTRKPACHAILEQKDFPHGLREVLRGETKISDALVRYRVTRMDMLLEKKGNTRSADLITSERMKALLEWARKEYDYIVLDLPPIVAGSDTESMKELADASVLVVRQNVAAAKAVNKAVATLDGGRAKLIGCVLNNVYSTRLTSGEGHRYGRYNRYRYYGAKD